ncbi:hypothetical protein Tco_1360769 [Tanacetum coccineum]
MNRWVRKEFNNFNEDARLSIQHWKDSCHKRVYKQNQKRVRNNPEDYFSNHKIIEVDRITNDQPHGLDFMEQIFMMRENDKPDSFSEADFKYLNKNDIEDLYYLYRNKKATYRETKLMNSLITFIRSRVIWERVHDFQMGIESYQVKVNLTAPTLTVLGIEEYEPYSIVDMPNTGLIYLNSKNEKRVTYLVEIVTFCDATLEKVLKEVKLKIYHSEPWKKPPLLGELDRDIMRVFEREISNRLKHQEQMRRWESFVNGRPILLTMKRLLSWSKLSKVDQGLTKVRAEGQSEWFAKSNAFFKWYTLRAPPVEYEGIFGDNQKNLSSTRAFREIYRVAWPEIKSLKARVITRKIKGTNLKHKVNTAGQKDKVESVGKQCDLGDKYWSDQDGNFFTYFGSPNQTSNKDAVSDLVDAFNDLVDVAINFYNFY